MQTAARVYKEQDAINPPHSGRFCPTTLASFCVQTFRSVTAFGNSVSDHQAAKKGEAQEAVSFVVATNSSSSIPPSLHRVCLVTAPRPSSGPRFFTASIPNCAKSDLCSLWCSPPRLVLLPYYYSKRSMLYGRCRN